MAQTADGYRKIMGALFCHPSLADPTQSFEDIMWLSVGAEAERTGTGPNEIKVFAVLVPGLLHSRPFWVLVAGATVPEGPLPLAARLQGPSFRFSQPNAQPLPEGHSYV
jgi:hypothetical protein